MATFGTGSTLRWQRHAGTIAHLQAMADFADAILVHLRCPKVEPHSSTAPNAFISLQRQILGRIL